MDVENHTKTLEQALTHGKRLYPNAPNAHHAAFANSVAYLVCGVSGGYGGPSAREHAVSHALAGKRGANMGVQTNLGGLTMQFPDGSLPSAGEWKFEDACKFAEPICYGSVTALHFNCWRTEHCFDDCPEDIENFKNFKSI